MNRVRLIGIGSPVGDDSIGWEAIRAIERSGMLERFPAGSVEACCCDRPGGGLLSLFEGVTTAIVMDAMVSGAAAGTVRKLAFDELEQSDGLCSSHGFSVAETVALGQVLGQLPEHLIFYGIEAHSMQALSDPQPIVRAAMPALLRAIESELATALAS